MMKLGAFEKLVLLAVGALGGVELAGQIKGLNLGFHG